MKETEEQKVERRRPGTGVKANHRESNRRAFPRWPLDFEVRYGKGKETIPAEGYEIGEGGLSFKTPNPFPLETELNVEYRLTADHPWVKVRGVVKHCGHDRMGAEFLNLRMRDRLEIVRLIAERK